MDEQERLQLITEELKEKIKEIKEQAHLLKHQIKKCRELRLDALYDRRDIQTVDILQRQFLLFWHKLMSIFISIEILARVS